MINDKCDSHGVLPCSLLKRGLRFEDFLEANCVRGDDKYVHLQTLESAFAFFLKLNKKFTASFIEIAHSSVPKLIQTRGFQMSPGYVSERTGVDTRHVVGISVFRFKKVQV
jgi:hypothetical protein